jgi:hypothetical protein
LLRQADTALLELEAGVRIDRFPPRLRSYNT